MLLTDAVEEFLRSKGVEGLAATSVERYRSRLHFLLDVLERQGVRVVADVVAADLDALFQVQVERGLARATRRGMASVVREFFRAMHARCLTVRNPARALPVPDDDDAELPEPPLSVEEVTELLASLPRRHVIDLRNRAHLELLYGCALRLGESIGLDLGDVDFGRRLVRVRADTSKSRRERWVPLMRGTAAAVQDYLAVRRSLVKRPGEVALFLDRRGGRLRDYNLRAVLHQLGKRRGRRYHPHLFRHSIAVHLLRGGADIRHVQEFLGHASMETTKIYLRMVPGHLREEYDRAMPMIAVDLPRLHPGELGG